MSKPLAAVDEKVVIPAAVKRQVQRAEELANAQKAAREGKEPPKEPTPVESPVAAEPPKAPAEPTTAATAAPASPTPAPAEAPPETPPTPAPTDWEHRYKSMEGRYKRDVPGLRNRVAELETTIADLQQRMAAPSKPENNAPERLITDQELSEYGPELLEIMGKKAKEELTPLIRAQAAEIAELKAQLSGTTREVTKTARQRMFETLDDQCPEWRDLDSNDKFIAWLDLPDDYSGVKRVDLLNAANRANDASRVMAFFKGFLASEAASRPAPAAPPSIPREPPAPKVPLETFAAPGRAKSTATSSVPAEKPLISRSEITAFYTAKAAGRVTPEYASSFERELQNAMNEGRIIQ